MLGIFRVSYFGKSPQMPIFPSYVGTPDALNLTEVGITVIRKNSVGSYIMWVTLISVL